MKFFIPRFIGAVVFFVVLTVLGTVGYVVIEGASIFDSFYMTVITITAVGFDEHIPLSNIGRTFTASLLAMGMTGLGIWFALITSFIVELDLTDVLRRRKMENQIDKLTDHVVLCGSGRTGRQVMEELLIMGQQFVVLERDSERIDWIYKQYPGVLVVQGDATVDSTLAEAGVERASGLLTCLSADTDNVFVCLSARHLKKDLNIVARALEDESVDKLYRAGADHVVSPNVSGAIRMTAMLLRPEVVDFLDVSTRSQGLSLRFEQAAVPAGSRLVGKTLAEARIPQETGLLVIALRKKSQDDNDFVFNPGADALLDPGDEMIVLGEGDQIQKLKDYVTA
jgi:voltage-gated potassium channel